FHHYGYNRDRQLNADDTVTFTAGEISGREGVGERNVKLTVPIRPIYDDSDSVHAPSCINANTTGGEEFDGVIGVTITGILIYKPFDNNGCAYDTGCQMEGKFVAPCFNIYTNNTNIIGLALDGHVIYDDGGKADECNGGIRGNEYGYTVTKNFPFMIGCFVGSTYKSAIEIYDPPPLPQLPIENHMFLPPMSNHMVLPIEENQTIETTTAELLENATQDDEHNHGNVKRSVQGVEIINGTDNENGTRLISSMESGLVVRKEPIQVRMRIDRLQCPSKAQINSECNRTVDNRAGNDLSEIPNNAGAKEVAMNWGIRVSIIYFAMVKFY
ncbi:unnamed protein product, partial [Owenia fusiformis]